MSSMHTFVRESSNDRYVVMEVPTTSNIEEGELHVVIYEGDEVHVDCDPWGSGMIASLVRLDRLGKLGCIGSVGDTIELKRYRYGGISIELDLGIDRFTAWCSIPSARRRQISLAKFFKVERIYLDRPSLMTAYGWEHAKMRAFCEAYGELPFGFQPRMESSIADDDEDGEGDEDPIYSDDEYRYIKKLMAEY